MNDAMPLFGLAALVLSLSAFVHVSVRAWLSWRAAERADQPSSTDVTTLAAGLQEQLARVERTLEAQGTELERLGEAQRFAARLLAGRATAGEEADPAPRVPGRVVTPH
jgi:hypothetical protein